MTEKNKLFTEREPEVVLDNVVLDPYTRRLLDRVVLEHQNRNKLLAKGLKARRLLLFYGSPGTGKTFAGEALAGELKTRFFIFNLESIAGVEGSTALAILTEAFEQINALPGVYLFDEFDAIASNRNSQARPEGRQIVNSLLINFETFKGGSIVIAATNLLSGVDGAFRRRFDTICAFDLPTREEREDILRRSLHRFEVQAKELEITAMLDATQGLSLHETEQVIESAAKDAVLENRNTLNLNEEIRSILDRKEAFKNSFQILP